MRAEDSGYCLVLGGGGAKGVYHIGVWRALRELGVRVDAFIGASVGAIVGAFLAQDSGEELEELGRGVSMGDVIALPRGLAGATGIGRSSLGSLAELARELGTKGGLDTEPLRRLLSERLDERALRARGVDFGVVTINLGELEPREVYLDDMAEGSLVDYVMASSAFPLFKKPRIEGKAYVDGGVYDNVPYAAARRRGYRRIIVSDVSGLGWNRRPQIEGSATVYIKNSVEMGGVLDFDRGFLDSFTLLGYLDTMRSFGALAGYSYFLRPDPEAEAAFARSGRAAGLGAAPERMRSDRRRLLRCLECAASSLEVDRVRAYSYAELEAAIAERRSAVEAKVAAREGATGGLASLVPDLRDAVNKLRFEECPYYYYRLVRDALPGAAGSVLVKALESLYPELVLGSSWLESGR